MNSMKFCPECYNLLEPELNGQKILIYACGSCGYQEVADDTCLYRVSLSAGNRTQASRGGAADPTLPRTKNVKCEKCGHGEAVFFQETPEGEESLALFFICCNSKCQNKWRE